MVRLSARSRPCSAPGMINPPPNSPEAPLAPRGRSASHDETCCSLALPSASPRWCMASTIGLAGGLVKRANAPSITARTPPQATLRGLRAGPHDVVGQRSVQRAEAEECPADLATTAVARAGAGKERDAEVAAGAAEAAAEHGLRERRTEIQPGRFGLVSRAGARAGTVGRLDMALH